VPEIIAKKVYHRGTGITPRDIFDIAASSEEYADAIIKELASYRGSVARTLTALDKLKLDFVTAAINQLAIKEAYRSIASTALEKTKDLLRAV
jgi:hypothetical protein